MPTARTVVMMKDDPLPPPTPIIGGGLLNQDGMMLITGPEKVGKSTMVTYLGWCMASGTPFFQWPIEKPLRVLYIQLENNPALSEELTVSMGMPFNMVGAENYYQASWLEWTSGKEDWEDLGNMLDEVAPDVLIIDPLYLFYGGAENSNDEARNFLVAFRNKYAGKYRALVLLHHHSKDHADTAHRRPGQRSSGASVWARYATTIFTLNGSNPTNVLIQIVARHAPPVGDFRVALLPDLTWAQIEGGDTGRSTLIDWWQSADPSWYSTTEIVALMQDEGHTISERTVSRCIHGHDGVNSLLRSEARPENPVVEKRFAKSIKYMWVGVDDHENG